MIVKVKAIPQPDRPNEFGWCEKCDQLGTGATWRIDPYMQELMDQEIWGWWCEACYRTACEDI